jgi:hypothetical protein
MEIEMTATLKVTHEAIGAEVRRGTKSFLPIFLLSFFVPSLALQLRREADDRSL